MFEVVQGVNKEGNEPEICEVNFSPAVDLGNKPQNAKDYQELRCELDWSQW